MARGISIGASIVQSAAGRVRSTWIIMISENRNGKTGDWYGHLVCVYLLQKSKGDILTLLYIAGDLDGTKGSNNENCVQRES